MSKLLEAFVYGVIGAIILFLTMTIFQAVQSGLN